MKFLHNTADVFLYVMHKKLNIYVYLESDSVDGNFHARIMKFIVTRRPLRGGQGPPRAVEPTTMMIKPLQFIRHTEIRFL
jgi:hypothetical protein